MRTVKLCQNKTKKKLQIATSRPQIATSRLQLQTSSRTITKAGNSNLEAPGSNLKAPDCSLQVPDCNLEAPDSNLQAPDCNLQAPDSNLEAPDSKLACRRVTWGGELAGREPPRKASPPEVVLPTCAGGRLETPLKQGNQWRRFIYIYISEAAPVTPSHQHS